MKMLPRTCMYSILSIFLGLFGGCPKTGSAPDAAPPDAPAPQQGTAEIGTGTVQFEPLLEDAELILWAGPQGGHHFIVHARIQDLEPGDWQQPSQPENPRTTFSAFDATGRQVDLMLPPYALGYRDQGDTWWYLPSGRFLRADEIYVPELFGSRVRIVVEVVDANGNTSTDERWITAVPESQIIPDAGVP